MQGGPLSRLAAVTAQSVVGAGIESARASADLMRAFFLILVSVVTLSACQDENASNSGRETHMGAVHAAQPAAVTNTLPATNTSASAAAPSPQPSPPR
jgi:hypothetical protein